MMEASINRKKHRRKHSQRRRYIVQHVFGEFTSHDEMVFPPPPQREEAAYVYELV
jgi:hypothetical protein